MQRADPEFLEQLLMMGFPEVRAAKALLRTHNCGVEPALAWLLEHAEDADIDEPWAPGTGEPSSSAQPGGAQWGLSEGAGLVLGLPSGGPVVVQPDGRQAPATLDDSFAGDCKVVLVVASELRMGAGKVAAQCAHAALGLYRSLLASGCPWLRAWEAGGERTVVLSADTCGRLDELAAAAREMGLQAHMVYDAGFTEVPAGSNTVLAVGGEATVVDAVTGQLNALR